MVQLVDLLFAREEGERIPSERELAETLGISRTATRDRINRLTALGALRREERSGTFFTGLRPEAVSESLLLSLYSSSLSINSLISVRHALERQAAIEASVAQDLAALVRMKRTVQLMEISDDGVELRDLDREFHEALFAASQSPGLLFFSEALHPLMRGLLRTLLLEQDRELMRCLHADIYEAIRDADSERATVAVDEHFRWLAVLIEREIAAERADEVRATATGK